MKTNNIFSYNTFRKGYSVLLLSAFTLFPAMAEEELITVFSDDFNRSAVSPGGSPSVAYNIYNSASVPVLIDNNSLRVTGANGTATGQVFILGDISVYESPFNPILDNNADYITWGFNIRHNYNGNLSGFGDANRGCGVILAADNEDLTIANGYAIVNGGDSDNAGCYRLVKFANGINGNNNLTTLLAGQSVSNNNRGFVSCKIVYVPATNTWKLFDRNDGTSSASDWKDPFIEDGYVPAGEITDATYTGRDMKTFGFVVRNPAPSGIAFNIWFDNYKVALAGVEAELSSEARLSDLSVSTDNGATFTTCMLFTPDTYSYEYYLTKDQEYPVVSATKMHQAANEPVIEQASAGNNGIATIEIKAEDGTIKTYTIEFIRTDLIFLSGLSNTTQGRAPEGWGANNMYFASSTTDGNNKYEGSNYARCLNNATTSHITLPPTKEIGTLYFYARKIDNNVTGNFSVSKKTGDGEWTLVKDLGDIHNNNYEEFSVLINEQSEEDILIRINITKNGGEYPSVGYHLDDFAYTAYDVGTGTNTLQTGNDPQVEIEYISGGFAIIIQEAEVSLFTATGMKLEERKVSSKGSFFVNEPGVYIIRINTEGKTTNKKIFIR